MTQQTRARLEGRRALVTGASRGLGRAIAIGLAQHGADVAVNYKSNQDAAESTVGEIRALGRRAIAVQGDTSVGRDVDRMVGETIVGLGYIDLLVNNAGVLKRSTLFEITEEEWDWVVGTNLKGYFLVSQAAARHMVERKVAGAIINISSDAQVKANTSALHYAVSKAGVGMLTKALALELAPHRIRVNALCSGIIETDMNRRDLANAEFRNYRLSKIPLKEIGKPEDIVGPIVFLASNEEARLVTGASLYADAGVTVW